MTVQIRAHELRRGDVLVDGLGPAVVTTVADGGVVDEVPYVQISARSLDPDVDNKVFDFLEERQAPRVIADDKWAG